MKKELKSLMRNILRMTAVFALPLLMSAANDQAQIKGFVKDKATQAQLARARVALLDSVGKTILMSVVSDSKGAFEFRNVQTGAYVIQATLSGYRQEVVRNVKVSYSRTIHVDVLMKSGPQEQVKVYDMDQELHEVSPSPIKDSYLPSDKLERTKFKAPSPGYPVSSGTTSNSSFQEVFNTEEYSHFHENEFHNPKRNPLSTFSIDVDRASYSNMRRFITSNRKPPADAIRIEEMVNYFDYKYAQPKGEHPFNIITEFSECPWNRNNKLVHIGLQGKIIAPEKMPPSNFVFLIDVSGSMSSPDKLPLVKKSLYMLVENLRPEDYVAIVVYAGAAGLVLPPTSGENKQDIISAIERLSAGGSTAGGAGIKLAYKTAYENFLKNGNNRVLLATDGDFNVGVSSEGELVRIVEKERENGVFLTVLGFGTGNLKDSKMEQISNKGNGNYAYIDNISEAKKVLVKEMGGTLYTIAKDVKIQVEFNPAKVKEYKLVGYENRVLKDQDFNDDTKDAGELGSGHTVTALYEIVPVNGEKSDISIDPLKYQQNKTTNASSLNNELMTIKFRYKKPDGNTSRLIVHTLNNVSVPLERTSENFRFSAAVAQFGLILRDSKFRGNASTQNVLALARGAMGRDEERYRAEFVKLVEQYEKIAKTNNGDVVHEEDNFSYR